MLLSYPANVKIVKVPCTGRVDVIHMLRAFEEGLDGVCVIGCLDGDCHFQVGNVRAKKRVVYAQALLDEAGIGGERLAMFQVSSAEGNRFAQAAREMTERIRALGPSPVGSRVPAVDGGAVTVGEGASPEPAGGEGGQR